MPEGSIVVKSTQNQKGAKGYIMTIDVPKGVLGGQTPPPLRDLKFRETTP